MISAFTENMKETTGVNVTHLFNLLNPRPSKKKKIHQKGFDEHAAAKQTQADGHSYSNWLKKKTKKTVARL